MAPHQQAPPYYNDPAGQMNTGYHDAPYSHDMQANRYENLSQFSEPEPNFASRLMSYPLDAIKGDEFSFKFGSFVRILSKIKFCLSI